MNVYRHDKFMAQAARRLSAQRFIVLIGIVSLFGDMTYEGARSVVGQYLANLGASATVVGVTAGLGELAGYALRLASGYAGDRTGRYWAVTVAGYVINLLAVPLLALAGTWPLAAALVIMERTGRALRTPTRDSMLSSAATLTGAGWAFGLHEALDTTGAIVGPLAVAAALYVGLGYKFSFAMLAMPACLSILSLLLARSWFPNLGALEIDEQIGDPQTLPRLFWICSFAGALIAVGYADFSLIAYHFAKAAVVTPALIPVFYSLAMAAAAIAALLLGRLFDRIGSAVMIPATLISAVSAPLTFLGGPLVAALGVVCWGIGMGAQESIMRALIGSMAPRARRGTAFGLFHAIFGIAWFAGSAALGFIYDHSVIGVAAFSLLFQLAAVPLLIAVVRQWPSKRAAS